MFKLTARVLLTVVIATALWLSLYDELDDGGSLAPAPLAKQWTRETASLRQSGQSPLPSPIPIYPLSLQNTVLYAGENGDVALYDLRRGREFVLAEGIYFAPWDSESPHHYLLSSPPRVSPDGHWLLIPTPDRGTWLIDLHGGEPRQISAERLSATWSPDSRRIAYGHTPLYIQDVVESAAVERPPRALSLPQTDNSLLPRGLSYLTWTPGCGADVARVVADCDQLIMGITFPPDLTL